MDRKSLILKILIVVGALFAIYAVSKPGFGEVQKATGPTMDKTSILFRAYRTNEWVGEKEVWKWYPKVEFRVNGPISAGSQIYIEYSKEGKPWFSCDCDTQEIEADHWLNTSGCKFDKDYEGKAIEYVGFVNFAIKMKNELEGTNTTLFSGKFKAMKNNPTISDSQSVYNQYKYYIDYDWTLPFALLSYTGRERSSGCEFPEISMWFPGDNTPNSKLDQAVAYLFYNGKKISSSADADYGGRKDSMEIDTMGAGRSYSFESFYFGMTCVIDNSPPSNNLSEYFHMDKNPGEYEVKVLWYGKLARSVKFSVGADGKVVDNGIAKLNNLGTLNFDQHDQVFLLPVKVIGNNGLTCDLNAWKTDAYWGNPLKGFALPQ